ncbi:uncharacterized protein BX664DRAFT_310308 [Halteromyces radiatus]|uniref:uncharacterized protein n=1 Tax=Halteromyces radiatus TaxID=101107 RepID=UPI00221E62DB|nr:uncharacterized protein BX664DRAFT_310308 [Halteromyces radiatus]KAI8099321.1 hypothetical protein BX664DRAFT_310308 [Halteromyces radiatus]
MDTPFIIHWLRQARASYGEIVVNVVSFLLFSQQLLMYFGISPQEFITIIIWTVDTVMIVIIGAVVALIALLMASSIVAIGCIVFVGGFIAIVRYALFLGHLGQKMVWIFGKMTISLLAVCCILVLFLAWCVRSFSCFLMTTVWENLTKITDPDALIIPSSYINASNRPSLLRRPTADTMINAPSISRPSFLWRSSGSHDCGISSDKDSYCKMAHMSTSELYTHPINMNRPSFLPPLSSSSSSSSSSPLQAYGRGSGINIFSLVGRDTRTSLVPISSESIIIVNKLYF